jgi:hypothetical protein
MSKFDYATQAELFALTSRKSKPRSVGYRRFDKAAEAIRFAIEELPPELLVTAYLEVDEQRFDGAAIRRLYESAEYPLRKIPDAQVLRGTGGQPRSKSHATGR